MKTIVACVMPGHMLHIRRRADLDRKRPGRVIPHLFELCEALEAVNLELGAMPVSGPQGVRCQKSEVRLGAQKAFVRGDETDGGESTNSEHSTNSSSDESDADESLHTTNDVQSRAMRNPPALPDGANSLILNILKKNVTGLCTGATRSFGSNRDHLASNNESKPFANTDDSLNEGLTFANAPMNGNGFIYPPRLELCKVLDRKEDVADASEIASPYTDIESLEDTLVDQSFYGAEKLGLNSPIEDFRYTAPLSPLSDTSFKYTEPSPGTDISVEDDTVIHNKHAIKFNPENKAFREQGPPKPRCNISTNWLTGNDAKLSMPLRVRSRTNEGMVELKAGTTTANKPKRLGHQHRRKMSLGLPINIHPSPQYNPPPAHPPTISPESTLPTISPGERDLEYKHRHTFIGTASLDDFFEILELSPDHTTTKAKIAKAFVILASTEQSLARLSSSHRTGWEHVSRITPDISTAQFDYLALAHVKLGSITLRQFLELISFDDKEVTAAMGVVEAFCAASHLGKSAESGTGSKAKAFRVWMLKQ